MLGAILFLLSKTELAAMLALFSNIDENRALICPGLNAYEIQIPYDKHHKVSSLGKRQQNRQFCQI